MNRIDFNNIQEKDYLYNSCSLFYDKYFTSNDKENLKSFEREIWMIGSELIDNIRKTISVPLKIQNVLLNI